MVTASPYAKAVLPNGTTVLGLRLRPFSLGHYIILRANDVSFVADEVREATQEDLIFSAFVCAQTYEEFLALSEDPKEYGDQVSKWAAMVAEAGVNVEEDLGKFVEYIKAATASPVYFAKGSGEPSGMDWAQAMKICLVSDLGYSRSDAYNAPFGEALRDYLGKAERDGAISLASEFEIEQMRAMGVEV